MGSSTVNHFWEKKGETLPEKRVGLYLPLDGRRRTVARQNGRLGIQRKKLFPDASKEQLPVAPWKVSAAHRARKENVSAKDDIAHDVGEVPRRVARCGPHLDHLSQELDCLATFQELVGRRRGDRLRPKLRSWRQVKGGVSQPVRYFRRGPKASAGLLFEGANPADVIPVRVGDQDIAHFKPLHGIEDGRPVATGVDDETPA